MQTQRLNISLPYEIVKQLYIAIPQGKRSKFIAETLAEKLMKKRDLKKALIKSLKANREYYNQVGKEISEDFKYADAEILERLP